MESVTQYLQKDLGRVLTLISLHADTFEKAVQELIRSNQAA